jgi:hypothetical protein
MTALKDTAIVSIELETEVGYRYIPAEREMRFPDNTGTPYQPASVEILSVKCNGVEIINALDKDEITRIAMDIKHDFENE